MHCSLFKKDGEQTINVEACILINQDTASFVSYTGNNVLNGVSPYWMNDLFGSVYKRWADNMTF